MLFLFLIRNNLLPLKYKIKHIMNYGLIIKKLRKEKYNENQVDFAKRIGITQSYLSSIEKGNKKPSIELLERIGIISEIPVAVLLWNSVTENDISHEKRDIFKSTKPSIDSLILSFF